MYLSGTDGPPPWLRVLSEKFLEFRASSWLNIHFLPTAYSFPSDHTEQEIWEKSLPLLNQLNDKVKDPDGKIMKTSVVSRAFLGTPGNYIYCVLE